jgi:hypothetical protein
MHIFIAMLPAVTKHVRYMALVLLLFCGGRSFARVADPSAAAPQSLGSMKANVTVMITSPAKPTGREHFKRSHPRG